MSRIIRIIDKLSFADCLAIGVAIGMFLVLGLMVVGAVRIIVQAVMGQ
jgi:hypothetical protein